MDSEHHLPGFEANSWYSVSAPKNTHTETIDKLKREINEALADPKIKARLGDLGGEQDANEVSDVVGWSDSNP